MPLEGKAVYFQEHLASSTPWYSHLPYLVTQLLDYWPTPRGSDVLHSPFLLYLQLHVPVLWGKGQNEETEMKESPRKSQPSFDEEMAEREMARSWNVYRNQGLSLDVEALRFSRRSRNHSSVS